MNLSIELFIVIGVSVLALNKGIELLINFFRKEKITMQGKILGGYVFTSKSGKELVNLSVTDERLNGVGECSLNIMTLKDSLPLALGEMVGKEYVIDCRYGSSGSPFAQSFYKVK